MGKRVVTFLVVFAIAFMVVTGGCIGQTESNSPTSSQSEESSSVGSYTTSSESRPTQSTSPGNGVGGIEGLYGLTHVKYSSDGTKWISVWVDNAQWRSNSPEFHFITPESSWFYSSGHLYAFDYGGETLYRYSKEGNQTPYPWFLLKMPYDGIAFHRAGPEGAILVLDREGKLHLIVYDQDKTEKWPSNGYPKVIYYPEIKQEFSWDVGGNHLAAGWNYDENYIYYVTWGGNKVWMVSFTNSELADLLDGTGEKPKLKAFTFDSNVNGVIVGNHGIYVWAGGKLHAFDMEAGKEVSATDVPGDGKYYLDIEPNEDVLCFYDGTNAVILYLSNGELNGKETVSISGYDFVGYDKYGGIIFAFKGVQVDFYDYDPGLSDLEYRGSLALPAVVDTGDAFISTDGDAYAYFWGTDGRYYAVNGELREITETQTSTQTPGTETKTQTSTSTTTPGTGSSVLENPFNAEGINFTKNGYQYFGLKMTPKEGYFEYFPYGDEAYLYQVIGKYVLRIYPWDSNYWGGRSSTPEIKVPTPDLLPVEPKAFYGVPNGDDYLLAGKDGKLHVLVGYGGETGVNGVTVDTFKAHIAYDFDADGVVIDKTYNEYIAWKGKTLRVYAYTDDEHYAMVDEGKEIYVTPAVYELPESIVEVNPYLDDDFLVVRTEGGLYLIPKPNGRYGDDTHIYRIMKGYVDFVGGIHYWRIWDLIAYKDGTVYHLEVDYDSDEFSMKVTIDAKVDVPGVVGLYGLDSQEPYFAVFTSDGRLLVYDYVWDDAEKGYVFKLVKSYDFDVPLVRFYADYRPEWGRIEVRGTDRDGTFYIIRISEPNAG